MIYQIGKLYKTVSILDPSSLGYHRDFLLYKKKEENDEDDNNLFDYYRINNYTQYPNFGSIVFPLEQKPTFGIMVSQSKRARRQYVRDIENQYDYVRHTVTPENFRSTFPHIRENSLEELLINILSERRRAIERINDTIQPFRFLKVCGKIGKVLNYDHSDNEKVIVCYVHLDSVMLEPIP